MSRILESILELPEDEQLDYALEMVRNLTQSTDIFKTLMQRFYKLTPKESDLLSYLLRRAGTCCSKERIYGLLYDEDSDVQPKIIDVYICKLRKRLGNDLRITTVRAHGFLVDRADAVVFRERLRSMASMEKDDPNLTFIGNAYIRYPKAAFVDSDESTRIERRAYRSTLWTEDDDSELIEMVEKGLEIWDIAAALGRTERGIRERINKLVEANKTGTRMNYTNPAIANPKRSRPRANTRAAIYGGCVPNEQLLAQITLFRRHILGGESIRDLAKISDLEPSSLSRSFQSISFGLDEVEGFRRRAVAYEPSLVEADAMWATPIAA